MLITRVSKTMAKHVANTATWNPTDKDTASVLSNGNLTVTAGAGLYATTRATAGVSSGKWYWELTIGSAASAHQIGIAQAGASLTTFMGGAATSYGYNNGGTRWNNASSNAYGATYTTADVMSILLDLEAGTLSYWKNGVDQGVAFSSLSGTFYPGWSDSQSGSAGSAATANFGASAFVYQPPDGYYHGIGII